MINRNRIFIKRIGLICLFYFTQTVFAQQPLDVAAFRKRQTIEERLDFLSTENVDKMGKATFEALLPVIEQQKDSKTLFYWHYQHNQFAIHFNYGQDEYQKSDAAMFDIAHKKGLKIEEVVAQYKIALDKYGGKRISEQEVYSAYLNCFEQMKSLGIENFKRYSPDWMLHEIGRNFYELGDTEKALEALLEGEKITKLDSPFYTLILNLIETIYADRKDYPNAIVYTQKIYDANYKKNPTQNHNDWVSRFWQGLSSLDMANYMFELGKVKECETLAERGYQLVQTKQIDFSDHPKVMAEFEGLQVVIKIKLRLGKLNEVESLFKRVEVLKPYLGLGMEGYYFKPLRLYNNYVTFYEAKKDYTNAYRYMKLADGLQDSLNRRNDKRKLWQTEMRVKADRYQAQIQSAEANSLWQERLRNAAIIILLIVLIAAFTIYRRIKKDNDIIAKQKNLLETSLNEKETLLKEIHHRVKNNLQIISGLLEKQALKATDAVTKQLMKEGQNRVFSMALVHQNLYQSENLNEIEIKSYLEMLTKNIRQSHLLEDQTITLTMDVDDSTVNIDTAIPLGLILNELITNCYKYAFKSRQSGEIQIVFHQKDKELFLSVKDNGIGLPADLDIQKTRTLGMNLVRGLVRQLNGTLNLQSDTEGSVFEIKIQR
jgi:two-component sensor histidine kinase